MVDRTPSPDPVSEAREGLLQHVDTLDAAGFDVHGAHAPAESWLLCEDQRCLRIKAALKALTAALSPAGPEEPREGLDILEQTAWPGFERHQHADGSWCQRKLPEAATPAPDSGAEERLRAALEYDAIPALLVFADENAGARAVIAKLRTVLDEDGS